MNIEKNFKDDLKKFKSAPFLFVGSGFSRRYLELENWEDLLKKFCIEGMKPFDYYKSRSNSSLAKTASLMIDDFHELWWEKPQFEESRKEYKHYGKMLQKDSPLKYEISKYLRNKDIFDMDIWKKDELEQFQKIVIDGIITTNWDELLENIFQEFDVFVGQKDLLSSVVHELAEIYKIHGSISDFNSLVLTKEDYQDFNKKNPYLAAKLLTIFIEHPIIFLGYSISDNNIINILKSISNCLSESGLEKIKENLFFVEPIFNNASDKYKNTYLNIEDYNLPITVIKAKDYSKVYKVLSEYERKISTKRLQQIKAQIYEIVKQNDPKDRIATIDIDEDTNFNEVEFVLGVGIKDGFSKQGYKGIEYDDLLEDVMLNNRSYDSDKIVRFTIPQVLRKTHYAPMYKYLYEADYLDENCNITKNVDNLLEKKHNEGIDRFKTQEVDNLIEKDNLDFNYISLDIVDCLIANIIVNGKEDIDLTSLNSLIISYIDNLRNEDFKYRSNLRKLIRIYDWLKYGVKSK